MENEPESLEELRRLYLEDRSPYVTAFQRKLDHLAFEGVVNSQDRRHVMDEANATRRLLAVAFRFGESDQMVNLSIGSRSFQLRTADRNKEQVYCGTSFPNLIVFDPHSDDNKKLS